MANSNNQQQRYQRSSTYGKETTLQKPVTQQQRRPQRAPQEQQKPRYEYTNLVSFSGTLGKDSDVAYTQKGVFYVKNSFAVWLPGGNTEQQLTHWFDLVYWGNLDGPALDDDEIATTFLAMSKGEKVTVTGTMTARKFQDTVYYGITVHQIGYSKEKTNF